MNSKYTSNTGLSFSHKHMPSAPVHGHYRGPKSVNKAQSKGRFGFKSVSTATIRGGKENLSEDEFAGFSNDDGISSDDNEPHFQGHSDN